MRLLRSVLALCLLTAALTACEGPDERSSPPRGESDGDGRSAPRDMADDDDARADGSFEQGPVLEDPAGPSDDDVGPDGDDALMGYACTEVATLPDDGAFSLRAFGDRLYVGLFGYGMENESMLWAYPDAAPVSPGLTGVGESVCALIEYEGALYANTENSGDIYRSSDGQTFTRVYDGEPGVIGCALEVFDGALYAANFDFSTMGAGLILRSTDGATFTEVWRGDNPAWSPYLRELAAHDGELFAFGTNAQADQGFALRSPDGESWYIEETPSRVLRATSWGDALYLGTTDRTSNGPAGVYARTSDDTTLVHLSDKAYVSELATWDGVLFAGTSAGWKEDVGTSSLLYSRDGERFGVACEFDELAVWSVTTFDGHLYVGTWEYGGEGKLYRVDYDPDGPGSEPLPDEPVVVPDDDDACTPLEGAAPVTLEKGHLQAEYTRRHNWVLGCYPYAYTASNHEEHGPCDEQFDPDGSRTGKAVFTFNVPRGMYDVDIYARHTENRNPAGALFLVNDVAKVIDQRVHEPDYSWDHHGRYCLEGEVTVVLDSTVNSGSDDVSKVRLSPVP